MVRRKDGTFKDWVKISRSIAHAALRSLLVALKSPRNGFAMAKGYFLNDGVGKLDTYDYLYAYQVAHLRSAILRRLRL